MSLTTLLRCLQRARSGAFGFLCAAALSTGASPAAWAQSVDGSSLDLGGQVVAPANSPTLYSTYGITGGDQIQWITYLQSKIDRPYEAIGTVTLPPNFSWVKGSVVMPPKVSMEWKVSNAWTSTEPATGSVVSEVRWKQIPLVVVNFGVVDSTVDFSGTGDGFRIIPYGQNLYVVNHHSYRGGNYFHCRVAKTGAVCPGFTTGGLTFTLGSVGSAIYNDPSGNAQTATNHSPMEALNRETGELFVGVYGNWYNGNPPYGASGPNPNAYILCTNLKTLTSCGKWDLGVSPIAEYHAIANYEFFEMANGKKKYYVQKNDGTLVCFDIVAKAECGRTKYPAHGQTATVMSTQLGGKMFFASRSKLWCHDPVTEAACAGWSTAGYANGGYGGVYPIMTAAGDPRGVCDTRGTTCRALNGSTFSLSTNARNFVINNSFASRDTWGGGTAYSTNAGAIDGSKVYFAPSTGWGVSCFDFATDTTCPGYPKKMDKYTQGYANNWDPTRPNCLLHLGNNAIGLLFDATTGGACTDGTGADQPKLMDVNPADYYRCDPTRSRVTGWDQVRLSQSLPWGAAGGLASVKVTLQDANGVALPSLLNPVRYFTSGQYTLSIADIPYAQYPRLKVIVQMTGSGGLGAREDFGMDVTWKGDPIQLCFQAKSPSPATCEQTASETVTLARFENLDGVFDRTLKADKVFSPGVPLSGYGAVSMATTLRTRLSDNPRTGELRTQIAQGRYDMSNFSGDLWLFDLNASGGVDTSSHRSAAQTLRASDYLSRPVYSAKANGSGVLGVMSLYSLNFNAAPAEHQAALSTTMSGARDNRGTERVNYLRGLDGSLRARSSLLGPVINSGPVLMYAQPTAGLSERQFPGYTAYRSNAAKALANRPPMALWGGNDGALHAFSLQGSQLREAWAFVPEAMLGRTAFYSDATVRETQLSPYFVDNVPMVGHADLSGNAGTAWTSLAVVTYGRGARAITALDLHGDGDIAAGRGVLFEYTHQTPGLEDLGYIVSPPVSPDALGSPQIVRLNDGGTLRWAVLVGNGVDSQVGSVGGTGRAVLYAFYLDNLKPNRWTRIAVDEALPAEPELKMSNGLSTPRPADSNGDGTIDIAYAGDQRGNLWRFDLSNMASVSVHRLFQTDVTRPILGAPLVVRNPAAGACLSERRQRCWQVAFGTGSYFNPIMGDAAANKAQQYLYSVLDKGDGTSVSSGTLVAHSVTTVRVSGIDYRAVQAADVDYADGKRGWLVALGANEHLTGGPRLQPSGQVLFPVNKPITASSSAGVCSPASAWLFDLNPQTGAPSASSYDVNGDNKIDANDLVDVNGKKVAVGAMSMAGNQFGAPAILLDGANASDTLSLITPGLGQTVGEAGTWGGSSGGPVNNSKTLKRSDKKQLGRMTWREVY